MERAFRSNRALVEIASASRSLHSAFAANSVSFPTSQRLPLHKRSTRNAIAPFRQSRRTPVPPRNPRALAAPSRHAHLAMPSCLSVSRAELRFHLENPERLQLLAATPTFGPLISSRPDNDSQRILNYIRALQTRPSGLNILHRFVILPSRYLPRQRNQSSATCHFDMRIESPGPIKDFSP